MVMRIPEVPDPPFPSGEPYWYWLGGRPCLDFVNTRRERWRRDVECLTGPGDLAAWLDRAGLLPGGAGTAAAAAAARRHYPAAVELREAIDAGVRAAVEGRPTPPAAVAVIDGWLARAATRPALTLVAGTPQLAERGEGDPVAQALGALALDAARLLGTEERRRARICAGECSARFYDRSPAGSRRWCSMQACGNVSKARRHRRRAASRRGAS